MKNNRLMEKQHMNYNYSTFNGFRSVVGWLPVFAIIALFAFLD